MSYLFTIDFATRKCSYFTNFTIIFLHFTVHSRKEKSKSAYNRINLFISMSIISVFKNRQIQTFWQTAQDLFK